MAGIPDDLMGDFWPQATPGREGTDYGRVTLSPKGRFEVRSFQTFTVVYRVGAYGLDDTGAIKLVGRWMNDGGALQAHDPEAINYVSARASNDVALTLDIERYAHQRPWYNGLRVTVTKGCMRPGETITVTLGDTSGGSPGLRLQTFAERAHEFKVLADVCATGVFLPVGSQTIEIAPAPPEKWILATPTLRRPGEAFSLGIRGEDAWGNASDWGSPVFSVRCDGAVRGLPSDVTIPPHARATRVEELSIETPGTYRFTLLGPDGAALAVSNPLVIRETGPRAYWGDLHGQSGETVDIDPLATYFRFARDVAFLDVTAHQANDFQVTSAFWEHINEISDAYNEDDRFTVFPGYEWSGNTPVGGDHNVFFAEAGRTIRRSSHALLPDRRDLETDANTLEVLFEALEDEDCVLFAHVGGRPADIARAENARLRTAVEVHSDWGTFEWILKDAFALGYRVGVVCNSDGHKGAPGACYPGASEFGAYSGLTCYLAEDLSRPAILSAMRARHHYGTTGCRMHLDVVADLAPGEGIFAVDPRVATSEPIDAPRAVMGDIIQVARERLTLHVGVEAHAPLERIDVFNGTEIVRTLRPYEAQDTTRLRVLWEGAEYRGRGRTTTWKGELKLSHAHVRRFKRINAWNPERLFEQVGDQRIIFDAVTTGNFGGCDLWLDSAQGAIEIDTSLVRGRIALADIGETETVLDAGGLERKVRLFRLPEELTERSLHESIEIALHQEGDNQLWVRVTTEDGFVAWSSPIYVVP